MTVRILGKSEFDCGYQVLSTALAVFVHVPTVLNEPVLEFIERDLVLQQG